MAPHAGTLLAALAALAAAGALAATLAEALGPRGRAGPVGAAAGGSGVRARLAAWGAAAGPWLSWTAAGASLAGLALLAQRFLVADLGLAYVFYYTRADLAGPWRLAGTWAGREGSFLLWATLVALVAAVVGARWRRMDGAGGAGAGAGAGGPHAHDAGPGSADGSRDDDGATAFGAWGRVALATLALAFLAAAAANPTFAPTPANLLAGRPLGNGLNPTLKSGYILIHPPLMFAAYAMASVPAAAAFAHWWTGSQAWSRAALGPSRLGWLLFTAAMGLGAMWAYFTLGFGGYWAWDPVEVANLLPWLALTAYLHAQLTHLRHGDHAHAGPILALLPLVFTLASTISTRSGLWVSVHAFTDPTDTFDPDAAARFAAILDAEPSLRFHLGLLLTLLFGGLALWCRRCALRLGVLPRASIAIAALLGALAGLAAIAPQAAYGLLAQAANLLPGLGVAYGMLAILFALVVLAAAPLLVAPASPDATTTGRRLRIDVRRLAALSTVLLALGLLVETLFHLAAVNGWSQAFHEARFPWLVAPVLLGLVTLGALPSGRRRALQATAVSSGTAALAAALALQLGRPPHGAVLAVLSVAALAALAWRVRVALAPAAPPGDVQARRSAAGAGWRRAAAPALLAAAALLDLVFWLSPPARLGWPVADLGWVPAWPVQPILGAAALALLGLALLGLAGQRLPAWAYAATGLLGGFWLAPLLAAAAWWLDGRARSARSGSGDEGAGAASMPRGSAAGRRARLRLAGVYLAHFAFALALVGYAPSTYAKEQATLELQAGGTVGFAGHTLTLLPATADGPAGRAATDLSSRVVQERGGSRAVTAVVPLAWEPQAQSHFPLPATVRHWDGDLYLNAVAVHVAPGSPCALPEGQWVDAYQGVARRPCTGATLDAARIQATWLPGVGLLWSALVLLVAGMALVLWAEPPQATVAARTRRTVRAPADDVPPQPGTSSNERAA